MFNLASRDAPPPPKSDDQLEEEREAALRSRARTEKLVKPFSSECPARFPMLSPYGAPLAGVLNTSMFVAKRDSHIKPTRLVTQLQLISNGETVPLGVRTAQNTHSAEFRQREMEQLQQQRMRAAMQQQQQQQHLVSRHGSPSSSTSYGNVINSNNNGEGGSHGGGGGGVEGSNTRDVPFSSNTLHLASYVHQTAPLRTSWIEPSPENLDWAAAMKSYQIKEFGQLDRAHPALMQKRKTLPKRFTETLLRRILHFCDEETLLDSARFVCRHWHSLIVRDPVLERRMKTFSPPSEVLVREIQVVVGNNSNNNKQRHHNRQCRSRSESTDRNDDDDEYETRNNQRKNHEKTIMKTTQPFVPSESWPSKGIVSYLTTNTSTLRTVARRPLTVNVCNPLTVGTSSTTTSASSSHHEDDAERRIVQKSSILRMMSATTTTSTNNSMNNTNHIINPSSSAFPSMTLQNYFNKENPSTSSKLVIPKPQTSHSVVDEVKKQSALKAAIISPPDFQTNITTSSRSASTSPSSSSSLPAGSSLPFHFATPSQPYAWAGVDFGDFNILPSSYCFRTSYRSRPSAWQLQGTRDAFADWTSCRWEILDARGGDQNTKFMLFVQENNQPGSNSSKCKKNGKRIERVNSLGSEQQQQQRHDEENFSNTSGYKVHSVASVSSVASTNNRKSVAPLPPPVAVLSSPLSSQLVHRALQRRFSIHSTRLGGLDLRRDWASHVNDDDDDDDDDDQDDEEQDNYFDDGDRDDNENGNHRKNKYHLTPTSVSASHDGGLPHRFSRSGSLTSHLSEENNNNDSIPIILQPPAALRRNVNSSNNNNSKNIQNGETSNNNDSFLIRNYDSEAEIEKKKILQRNRNIDEFVWGHFHVPSTEQLLHGNRSEEQQQQSGGVMMKNGRIVKKSTPRSLPHHNPHVIKEGYRRLRIVQAGRNASWGLELHICGFEVYGNLARNL